MVHSAHLRVDDIVLDVFDPQGYDGIVDRTINADKIRSVEYTLKVSDSRNRATIVLDNSDKSTFDKVPHRSRVEVPYQTQDDSSSLLRFSGLVTDKKTVFKGDGDSVIRLECDNFTMNRLSENLVTNVFRDRQAAGTNNSIIDTIVENNAPNVRDVNGTVTAKTTAAFNFQNLYDAVMEIASRTGAQVSGYFDFLRFDNLTSKSVKFDLTKDDFVLPDDGKEFHQTSDSLKNSVVVLGGQGEREGAKNDVAVDNYVNVNEVSGTENRQTAIISFPKAEMTRVDIQTQIAGDGSGGDSDDNLKVRIQETDGSGNPQAVDDPTQDLGRAELPASEINDGSYTAFEVDATNVPNNAAIIVESDGPDGQDVGRDSGNNLIYIAYYPFKVVARQRDSASIDKYFRKESRENTDVRTVETAEQIAQEEIDRNRTPEYHLTIQAARNPNVLVPDRAHRLEPREVVRVTDSDINVNSEKFFVRRKDVTIEDNQQKTRLELQNLASIGGT